MKMYLRIKAPFAAFRPMSAGWFRPTATMVTPSAAYGLLLNFAAIDSRVKETDPEHDGKTPASLTRTGLPLAEIALGIPEDANTPLQQTVLQQLHNYPVGASGMPKEMMKGNKNNITPVTREFLSELDFVLGVKTDEDFCQRIEDGIQGKHNHERYGLPFLGDNSFLIDLVKTMTTPPPTHWYEQMTNERVKQKRINDAARLTTFIDRAGYSGTKSAMFMPMIEPVDLPSESAWVEVGR